MINHELSRLKQSHSLFKHQGEDVYLFTLKNDKGVEVELSNLGAIIRSFSVPSSSGEPVDIVLGLDQMSDYLDSEYVNTKTYLGAVIGRYANRIENSSFELDGERFDVSANTAPHQLHGGTEGFDKKAWRVISADSQPNPKVVLAYFSSDGEEGFPGNLSVQISFELTDDSELIINTEAKTDKATPVNLTHHDYFNLNGSGNTDLHEVMINAGQYLSQKPGFVPSGEIVDVKDTKLDFNQTRVVKQDPADTEGFDQSFVIDKNYGDWGFAASCYSKETGIKLSVFTDEPTVHFYTGKHLNIPGKNGAFYSSFGGLCFETQHHTNAVNIKNFPSTILRPGEKYSHKTLYKVEVI